jgi:hypothetical protein
LSDTLIKTREIEVEEKQGFIFRKKVKVKYMILDPENKNISLKDVEDYLIRCKNVDRSSEELFSSLQALVETLKDKKYGTRCLIDNLSSHPRYFCRVRQQDKGDWGTGLEFIKYDINRFLTCATGKDAYCIQGRDFNPLKDSSTEIPKSSKFYRMLDEDEVDAWYKKYFEKHDL